MGADRPDEEKPPVQEPPPDPDDLRPEIRAADEAEPFDVPTVASIGAAPLGDLDAPSSDETAEEEQAAQRRDRKDPAADERLGPGVARD